METNYLSKSKTICVLAMVVCCFSVLWPKIFLPMFQQAVSSKNHPEKGMDTIMLRINSITNYLDNNADVSMMHPRMRAALGKDLKDRRSARVSS